MAFESAITQRPIAVGNRRWAWGTYTNGSGDTGGNIDTGLRMCENLFLQPCGSAVIATAPVINEDFPVDGSAVTVVTSDDEDGIWWAIGY
jgi:hypothetical protein